MVEALRRGPGARSHPGRLGAGRGARGAGVLVAACRRKGTVREEVTT